MTSLAPERRPLLLLSGFMGTGKSTVGRALAARTGARFEDLDAAVEAEAGRSIPEVFTELGEAAFRSLERALLLDRLAAKYDAPRVLALGGGTLVDPSSRRRALALAFVVTLSADVETIVARCDGGDRPLLADAANEQEAARRVQALLEARAEAYEAGHLHLATDHRSPEALAATLASHWIAARGG